MIILSCNNISKSYGIDTILKDLTFSIQKGDRVGLIGVNGAGKSTLLKILTKQISYDNGDLFIAKSTTIGYLEQSSIFAEDKTVFEEALSIYQFLINIEKALREKELEIASLNHENSSDTLMEDLMNEYALLTEDFEKNNGYGYQSEVKGVLKGLGFCDDDFDKPVTHLSGGEKTRLSLVKLLLSKPDILLLDEPTNHLDIQAVEWLEGFLKDYAGTVLMISHDRFFLDQLVTNIFEIENHSISCYKGNYSTFMEKKRADIEQQLRAYQNQQQEISKQKDIIRRLRQHGTEKLMNRAKSREKQLDKIDQVELPQQYKKKAGIHFTSQVKSGENVLLVKELCKSFDEDKLFDNASFQIYRGEKVALIGPNGIGKSTLFRILLNEVSASGGEFQLGHRVDIGYYDQEQQNLNSNKTLINEIWDEHTGKTETEIRTLLGRFLFHGDDVFRPISTLSGGEKARVSLLKLIMSKANFLLLDEPTNHLDIHSKEVLEDALCSYDGTILVISHDRYFLNRVSTKIIELTSNGTEEYLGNYDYYLYKKKEKLEESSINTIEEKTKTQLKEERRKEKEESNRLRDIKKNLEKLEASIIEMEERLSNLEALMCQEEIYSDPEKSKEINLETIALKEKLQIFYDEWESSIDIS
ncbi:ABC-F family ATP-binding cassette domain-containing protein [Alkaliphilus peptidifermentans]|uniref:ATP-binding cassette, subfamily F, member 3 n=1 Tax=Alkaliphilus peptidifermentans DSM 18978 TaxID=1120976 RepID=A0A1G5ICS1_9FIRM|nr:ABC-F family ATP-binding cassette domain-containing protein [Alkaliphilus peptidifermentans]SCY73803.1 ATP-binding cassette, subfamily F, member 3 [Alkaliphilus peptidifermentans DSM 18978]